MPLSNSNSTIAIVGTAITITSIIAASILNPQYTIDNAGSFIEFSLLIDAKPNAEQLFGKKQVNAILEQTGCEGVRVYYDSDNVFLVGTDAQGNDLQHAVLSFGLQEVGEDNLPIIP